jgi:hypothetical protein
MREYAQHNRVGIFRKLRHEGFLVQHYSGAYPYKKGNIILKSSVLEPIYSYGNNYKKHGIEFSLFIWTTESDIAKVEKTFDKAVKDITRDDLKKIDNKRFVYLDVYHEGDK